MTKREMAALKRFLAVVPDVEAWFHDLRYPARSRSEWDDALTDLKIACGMPDRVVRSSSRPETSEPR